ncbi:MAG: hypothetical protein JNK48_24185 [Bryobacterales bacterium]|nr:hypothetical protein [Bryobacterales bacterium]
MKNEEKVHCATPTPGKKGTWIAKWKYDAVRKAIRKVVPRNQQGVAFEDLPEMVEAALSEDERARRGSVMWYTVTVKLHLETAGELERVAGVTPQRVRRLK